MFDASDGDVYLLRTGGEPAVAVRQPAPEDRELLRRLAADAGVRIEPGTALAERVAPLQAAGLLIELPDSDPLPPSIAERFSRQLPWLAEHGDAAAAQQRMRAARVVVLGCGGLGTWAIGALACLGVGAFTVVDDDRVEVSNLNRQILFREADVGAAKAGCAARWLREFDPAVDVTVVEDRVRGSADVERLVAGAQLLVLAADWPPYELGRWVNEACVRAGVPFVTAAHTPPLIKVGPTYVPGSGPCFACHERSTAATFPLYAELAEHRRRNPGRDVTVGPAVGVAGALLALDAMALLAYGSPPATQGRAWLLDMRTLDQRWEPVERDPRCPVCGRM